MRRRLVWGGLAVSWIGACGIAFGQAPPAGGVKTIRLNVDNGTRPTPVTAEQVTVFQLGSGMTPVIELANVTFPTTIPDIPVNGAQPVLLQVRYQDVSYNQPVSFGEQDTADVEVAVYDTTATWDPEAITVTTSRILFRRLGDKMSIDKVYVIDNRSQPPVTYYDPEGSFRFHLPSTGLSEVRGVSAAGASGMPVPQPSFPLEGLDGVYASRTAMKPGETQIGVSYDVDYASGSHEMSTEAFYPLSELLVLVAPADIEITGDGWQNLGTEPEGRFAVARLGDVEVGDPIRLRLSGGSTDATDLVGSSRTPNANPAPSASQRITQLPDPTRAEKWIVVLLMGAALAFGLVSAVMARASPEEIASTLKRLEAEHDAGELTKDEYQSRKKGLQRQLDALDSGDAGR